MNVIFPCIDRYLFAKFESMIQEIRTESVRQSRDSSPEPGDMKSLLRFFEITEAMVAACRAELRLAEAA